MAIENTDMFRIEKQGKILIPEEAKKEKGTDLTVSVNNDTIKKYLEKFAGDKKKLDSAKSDIDRILHDIQNDLRNGSNVQDVLNYVNSKNEWFKKQMEGFAVQLWNGLFSNTKKPQETIKPQQPVDVSVNTQAPSASTPTNIASRLQNTATGSVERRVMDGEKAALGPNK